MSEGNVPVKERIEAAEANLDRLLEWIGRYDNKSSALLGIDTAMVGALALVIGFSGSSIVKSTSASIALLFLALAFVFLFIGAYPQLEGARDSLLFFGTIAKKGAADYTKSFREQTEQDYLDDLLGQCYRNSQILDQKFRYLKLAFQSILVAMIPWSLALLV